jgi:hypothetical protein
VPYGYILQIVTAVLAVRHLRAAHTSPRSKYLVGGLTAFAVLGPFLLPAFLPLRVLLAWTALPLQFAISGYVVFHQIIWAPDAEPPVPFAPPEPRPARQQNDASGMPKA